MNYCNAWMGRWVDELYCAVCYTYGWVGGWVGGWDVPGKRASFKAADLRTWVKAGVYM